MIIDFSYDKAKDLRNTKSDSLSKIKKCLKNVAKMLSNPIIFRNANGSSEFLLGRVPPVALAPKTLRLWVRVPPGGLWIFFM